MKHSSPTRMFVLLALVQAVLGSRAQAASKLFAGTDRGPYTSSDSGTSWKQIFVTPNDPVLQGLPKMLAMVVDPKNPSTVYASAFYGSDNAFLKSTDAGQTWSAISQPGFSFQTELAIDPVQTNVLYSTSLNVGAPTPTRNLNPVVRSTDSGVTWSPLKVPNPILSRFGATPNGPLISGIATDPNTTGVLYVIGPGSLNEIGNGYLFKSTDFGDTWSIIADGQDFGGDIYVDPRDRQVIYAANVGSLPQCQTTAANGGGCGLYKSSDGGKTWTALPLTATVVTSLAFDATPGVLYAGVAFSPQDWGVTRSTDGGTTWTQVKNGFAFAVQHVRADAGVPSTVYMGAGGPFDIILKSIDRGANWTTIRLPAACGSPTTPICSFHPRIADFVVAPPAPSPLSPPAITANGVVNAAGLQRVIVPNSWVTIFGTNLASKTDNWGHAIVNGQLPTSLDGVSVTIGGKAAYVYFISPGQINVLAPDIPAGPVSVTVTTAAGTSATYTATAAQYGPAFFEWPNSQPVATRQDYSYAVKAGTFAGATTVAAKPGDVLILWGTGFGPTNPAPPAGVPVPSDKTYATATKPTVTINNKPVTVYGAALASGSVGLYQVAIQVPSTLADGDWPIQATIGGVSSPTGVVLSVHH